MTLESSVVLRKTAAEVSSHDDSMPRIVILSIFINVFIVFISELREKVLFL